MKALLTVALLALAGSASANSLTDWNSLSPSQRVACCSSSSAQVHVRARVWDSRRSRWVSRYVAHPPRSYGADSRDCCEMPTHGND